MAIDVYPYDPATPVGQIRAIINDVEQYDYDQNLDPRYRLSDDMLKAFLAISRDRIYAAAADALRSLATNEALISKVIRTEDLQTDGAKLATELRLMARELEQKQTREDDELAYEDAFEIVDVAYPYINREW